MTELQFGLKLWGRSYYLRVYTEGMTLYYETASAEVVQPPVPL